MNIISTQSPEADISRSISNLLQHELPKNRVLLLLAGGSAHKVYSQLQNFLSFDCDYKNLTVCMGDERWDENFFHKNSNYVAVKDFPVFQKLTDLGAKIETILKGGTIQQDTTEFNALIQKFYEDKNKDTQLGSKVILVLGIGPDGHLAGILPSPAPKFKYTFLTGDYAVFHNHIDEKFPARITLTPKTILDADYILVYATGENKKPVLEELAKHNNQHIRDISAFPSKILCDRDATIYTDITL